MGSSVLPLVMTVVTAHFLALLSPGPDFMLIVKSGIRNGIRKAMGVSLGISCANGIYITLCIAGLGTFLAHSLLLLRALKAFGGVFLLYLALKALRAGKDDYPDLSAEDIPSLSRTSFMKEFFTGFISGISNPKNLVFYLSLFAMVLTGGTGLPLKIGLGIWMTGMVLVWDSFILLILSRRHVRKTFSGAVFYVDKAAGTVIGLLGIKLILTAVYDSSI